MKINPPKNANYCATIVKLDRFVDLENCDNVKHAIIFGNSVIVSKDTEAGTYGLFFPVETQLSDYFVKTNNLYRKSELNSNPKLKGYFEENRRIRCMKFRGHKSEGFFIPVTSLNNIVRPGHFMDVYYKIGLEFDEIDGIEICQKYVIKNSQTPGSGNKSDKKLVKRISRLAEGQFRLHVDTAQLRKNVQQLNPEDVISITKKLHGTSFVVGHVLTKRKQGWKDKLARWLGIDIIFRKYDYVYASRRVVKNEFETMNSQHYYSYDLWEEIKNTLAPFIDKSYTFYGECVGFLKDGAYIQKGYDYGCEPKKFEIYIHRITTTNSDGRVLELTWGQVKDICNKYGIKHMPQLYYGKAKDLFPISTQNHWHETFLKMAEEQYLEKDCTICNNKVPDEGIVVKKDKSFDCEPLKLKSFRFLEWETKQLDEGVIDIESEQ